jgi:hypothetical protein
VLQDFWSTEKERVYLVGVAYKQQYQQQQQQQQRRQQQQQQQRQGLFGSSNGGLAMSASSYSPWAAPAAVDAGDGSSSSSKRQAQITYNVHESLDELGRLAETAGLQVRQSACPSFLSCLFSVDILHSCSCGTANDAFLLAYLAHFQAAQHRTSNPASCDGAPQVVGSNYQALEAPNNSTYIGSGKVAEVARAVTALKVCCCSVLSSVVILTRQLDHMQIYLWVLNLYAV